MQVQGALTTMASRLPPKTTLSVVAHLYKAEGIGGFYRGFSAVIFGAMPAQATYFAAYEFGKSVVPPNSGVLGDMATGCIAQLMAGIAFTPVDVVKERLQVRQGPSMLLAAALDCPEIARARACGLALGTCLTIAADVALV
jgi:Mitochondrial carrier protein